MCWPPAPDARIGVDAQVGRIDLDLDRIVDFRVDEHARERRVPARVRVERALAHQPVHAGLGAQVAVRVFAVDLDRCALDAGDFARRLLEHLGCDSPCARSSAGTCAAASTPSPAPRCRRLPAWMSMKQLPGSSGLLNIRRNSRSSTRFSMLVDVVVDARRASRRRLRRAPARRARALSVEAASSVRSACGRRLRAASFPCRDPARAAGRPRPSGLRARASTSASRSAFTSKSKIPPQIGPCGAEARECVADRVDMFGFHDGTLSSLAGCAL